MQGSFRALVSCMAVVGAVRHVQIPVAAFIACATLFAGAAGAAPIVITDLALFPSPSVAPAMTGFNVANIEGISIAATGGVARLNPFSPESGTIPGLVLSWQGFATSYVFSFDAPILAFGSFWDFVDADDPDGNEQPYQFSLLANGVEIGEVEGLEPHGGFFGFESELPFDAFRMTIEPFESCLGSLGMACSVRIASTEIRYVPVVPTQPVPEPSSLSLFLLGGSLPGLGLLRSRRRSSHAH